MLIRPVLESDLPAVEKLEQQLFSSPWSLAQLNTAFNSGQWMWLVERQSNVAGYLIACGRLRWGVETPRDECAPLEVPGGLGCVDPAIAAKPRL